MAMQKLFAGKTVDGWGIVRDSPWHFAGVFPSEGVARRKAARLGPGYDVRYGQRGKGTFGFMVAAPVAERRD